MRVALTTHARSDLRAIALYIAEENPARARSFVAELRDVAIRIGSMPRAFPLIPRYEQYGIRRRSWRGNGVLYGVEADRIVVYRILGPGQDHDRALQLR